MQTKLYLVLVCLLAAACSGGPSANSEKKTEPLKASKLYDLKAVREYVDLAAHTVNLDIAAEYTAKGDAAQKANDSKALYYYRRALTYMPSAQGYETLAKYLLYKKQYDECIEALFTCIEVFEPKKAAPYGDYLVATLLSNQMLSDYPYADAIDRGAFTPPELIDYLHAKWPIIFEKKAKVITPFLANLNSEGGGEEEEYAVSFRDYLDEVPAIKLPFEISSHDLENFDYGYDETGNYYGSFFQECVGDDQLYLRTNLVARLPDTSFYHAVIYKVDSSMNGSRKNLRMIYYRLCTYNREGKIIDGRVIAAQLGERYETCSLEGDVFTVKTSRRKWSKPFQSREMDNDLLATEYVSSTRYTINNEGKIIESL